MLTRELSLRLGEHLSEPVGRRIRHAFRSFCAVYGYADSADAPVRLAYGAPAAPGELELSATYQPGIGSRPQRAPVPYARPELFADEEAAALPCLHPVGRTPDWLGEIFEWLGGEAERLAGEADEVGRVPERATLHGLHRLDPETPYAAVAMRGLDQDIARHVGSGWPGRPAPLLPQSGTAIVATHDLDFLPTSATGSLARALKNAAIATVVHRDPRLVGQIVGAIAREAVRLRSPLDTLGTMTAREDELGIRSASYVICVQRHRRDANYRLDHPRVRRALAELAAAGAEIGVHGSYTSLEGMGRLAGEYAALRRTGVRVRGGRQHWLRYRNGELFQSLAESGAEYDCSVGYPHRIGFRAGACFPYLPWDFANERPFPLLEIPLAVMDVALFAQFRREVGEAEARTRRLLRRATAYGWGGVSVLWHNTAFGEGQLPRALGELYWRLPEPRQSWMSGSDLVDAVVPRFREAGFPELKP
jgi:hypothetical protein